MRYFFSYWRDASRYFVVSAKQGSSRIYPNRGRIPRDLPRNKVGVRAWHGETHAHFDGEGPGARAIDATGVKYLGEGGPENGDTGNRMGIIARDKTNAREECA